MRNAIKITQFEGQRCLLPVPDSLSSRRSKREVSLAAVIGSATNRICSALYISAQRLHYESMHLGAHECCKCAAVKFTKFKCVDETQVLYIKTRYSRNM